MQTIKSLHELMSALTIANAAFIVEAEHAIAKSCVKVQATAKAKFGTYQDAVGPFKEWPALAESTIKAKTAAGSEGDDPLIGHYAAGDHKGRPGGGLRDSIQVEVKGLVGQVGTNDELAPDHEYGTGHIPPRPYLRPALLECEGYIKKEFMKAIAKGLMM